MVSQEEITLEQLCIKRISQSIAKTDDADKLPLPEKFKVAIKERYGEVYTPSVPERYKKVWKYLFEDKRYRQNTYSRFTDFFKFCLVDKRRNEDPYFLERMQRRRQEERMSTGERGSRRRDRDYFHDDFILEGFPWKDKNFWN